MVAYDQVILSMESRGGSLPQKSSDEWRAELRPRQNIGQSFSPQVCVFGLRRLTHLYCAGLGELVKSWFPSADVPCR